MTETKTPDPDCPTCAGTGFVPPFMDACDCEQPAPGPFTGPAVGTVTNIVEYDGSATTKVWNGSEWVPMETEALTPAEYHAKYGSTASTPDWLPPLTSAPMFAGTPAGPEIGDVGPSFEEWVAGAEEDEEAALAAAAAEVDAVDAEAEFEPVYTDDVVKATMTSADTFAALEAACDAVPATPTFGGSFAAAKAAAKPAHTMSSSQEALIAKLIAERDPANPVVTSVITRLASAPVDKKRASGLIDALMAVPADPARKPDRENSYDGVCKDCGGQVPAHTGVIRKIDGRWVTFHKTGECLSATAKAALEADRVDEPGLYRHEVDGDIRVYRVRPSRTTKRLYGELVIPHPASDGEPATASFAYNGKAMAFLRKSNRLTWAEARAFGAAYGACIACGRTLSDSRSLVQGYGATCAGHFHWPTVTTKQAEAIIAGDLTWDDVVSGLGVLTS